MTRSKQQDVEAIETLLREEGVPDPSLLEGDTWQAKDYRRRVDLRIHLRARLVLMKADIDQEAFELARRLAHDEPLRKRVASLLKCKKLRTALEQELNAVQREERAVEDAWLQARLDRCQVCGTTPSYKYEIRGTRRLCEECAARLTRRQRTTSTNIKPALAVARHYKLPATLTVEEWLTTISHFDDLCAYCGERWDVVEHATPTARKGGTTLANCLPSCFSCNAFKSSRTLEEWLEVAESLQGLRKEQRGRLEKALEWLRQKGRA